MRTRRLAFLASKFRPSESPPPADPIASEIRELRPQHGPAQAAAPVVVDKSKRALLALTEKTRHYVIHRQFGDARRTIADATALLEQVEDVATIALASVHLGEV